LEVISQLFPQRRLEGMYQSLGVLLIPNYSHCIPMHDTICKLMQSILSPPCDPADIV
jgi:hypothetical protein